MPRIVVVSDTHNNHARLAVPPGDVLVHCGDLTNRGSAPELTDVNAWLASLPHAHKVGPHARGTRGEMPRGRGPLRKCTTTPYKLPKRQAHNERIFCDRERKNAVDTTGEGPEATKLGLVVPEGLPPYGCQSEVKAGVKSNLNRTWN